MSFAYVSTWILTHSMISLGCAISITQSLKTRKSPGKTFSQFFPVFANDSFVYELIL